MVILYKFISKFLSSPVKMPEQLGWPTKATPTERKTSKYEKLDMKLGNYLGRGRDLDLGGGVYT